MPRQDSSHRPVIDGVQLRRADAGDVGFLREMLHLALFVAPGGDPFPANDVDRPELARIVAGFGTADGDLGWIAKTAGGRSLGAAWVRRFTRDAPGFGYVDDVTPELSIAVHATDRGRGIGTVLLAQLIDDVERMCLSVDARNPAVRLYERSGFAQVRREGFTITMLHLGMPTTATATADSST